MREGGKREHKNHNFVLFDRNFQDFFFFCTSGFGPEIIHSPKSEMQALILERERRGVLKAVTIALELKGE